MNAQQEYEVYLGKLRQRYKAAVAAMQNGVIALMNSSPCNAETQPKALRVGVNSAMVEHHAILQLLMDKGIVTEEEYLKALANSMEAEVLRYEEVVSLRMGRKVRFLRGEK